MPVVHEAPLACRHLSVSVMGDTTVVRFNDRCLLDHTVFKEVVAELSRVADRMLYRRIVLNFSGVVHFPSVLLGKLLVLSNKVADKNGNLLLCEVPPEVRDVFSRTKLDQIFNIRDSESDAV